MSLTKRNALCMVNRSVSGQACIGAFRLTGTDAALVDRSIWISLLPWPHQSRSPWRNVSKRNSLLDSSSSLQGQPEMFSGATREKSALVRSTNEPIHDSCIIYVLNKIF
jgi:hypothetical protein